MAGKDYGGRISVKGSTGYPLSLRGTINVNPARISSEGLTNQDGSLDRVQTPTSPSAELTFAAGAINLDDLISLPRHNITIIEETTGVTHLFTDAFYTGSPSSNRINGEVSGLSIMAANYSRLG